MPVQEMAVSPVKSLYWEQFPPMSQRRVYCTPVYQDGLLYVMGGCSETGMPLDSVEVLDVESQTWSQLPPLPTARAGTSAVALGGQVMVLGGMNQQQTPLASVEIYHPDEGRWETKASLGQACMGVTAVEKDGQVYVFGGMGADTTPQALVRVYDAEKDQWLPLTSMPTPRYGATPFCPSKIINQPGREFSSTKDFPDSVLQFARNHPLMWRPVHPALRQPVLVKTNIPYKLKQIVVDRVEAEDGQYDVMFIGTDVGTVLKVISLHSGNSLETEEVTLEELQVFKVPTPITSMDISVKRQALFVGSPAGVAQVRLHRCETYGKACAECCLARDPYCAWDGSLCSRYMPNGKRRYRRQDIRHGNPVLQCMDQNLSEELDVTEDRVVYGTENNSTFLECVPRSPQATVTWFVQRDSHKEEVKLDDRVMAAEQGLLFRRLFQQDEGVYICVSREHGFTQTLARLTLEVLQGETVDELMARDNMGSLSDPFKDRSTGGYRAWMPCAAYSRGSSNQMSQSRTWFKDIMQLIGPSNLPHVEEYCERMWCNDKLRRKHKSMLEKYRQAQESARKARSKSSGERNRTPRDLSMWKE